MIKTHLEKLVASLSSIIFELPLEELTKLHEEVETEIIRRSIIKNQTHHIAKVLETHRKENK